MPLGGEDDDITFSQMEPFPSPYLHYGLEAGEDRAGGAEKARRKDKGKGGESKSGRK
jgi:hypothetical protein